ncbi:MAG: family 20 glycosylhydrolase, partial [Bifidobacteriaceae bacterium]|nr:family 20 glycosylhydrolase [Bifidobacteriaceae bacterium]
MMSAIENPVIVSFNIANLRNENISVITRRALQKHKFGISNAGCVIHFESSALNRIQVMYDTHVLRITAPSISLYYRALNLALENVQKNKLKPFRFEEECKFEHIGMMLDCSRNGVPTVATICEKIELCSRLGYTYVYLYIEDLFEVPEYPYFGAMRGRYSKSELKQIDDFGLQYGIEVIPAIQTLAHMRTFLRWHSSIPLRDTDDILLVNSEKTLAFLKSIISEVSSAFHSNNIHIGMDEAHYLGAGAYLQQHGFTDKQVLMQQHLKDVLNICESLGLRASMWSDMFFRVDSPTGDYYDVPADTTLKFAGNELFNSVDLVYWDYYKHNQNDYDKNIELHRQLTDNIIFASGGWTWNGVTPNYAKAKTTIREGLKSCEAQHINNVCCTFWFDNGMETPVQMIDYMLIYFAQECFVTQYSTQSLTQEITRYSERDWMLIDALDYVPGTLKDNESADNPSKCLLYQDVLVGLFDNQSPRMAELAQYYNNLYEKLQAVIKDDSAFDSVFTYYAKLAHVLSLKTNLGVEIREAYMANNYDS